VTGTLATLLGRAGTPAQIPEPRLARFMFADVRLGWLWLLIRVYVGWQWLSAAIEKLQGPGWIGTGAGSALRGFVDGSIRGSVGAHAAVQGWYAGLLRDLVLPHTAVWSYAVTFGELAVGLALILGLFTGIAAFSGAFMNMNYMMAGTVSINPILLFLELFLILAWRVAGYLGLDFFALPWLGTPWNRGPLSTPALPRVSPLPD